jgi:phosphodiesterase/alkaline phosphatase D-like protein
VSAGARPRPDDARASAWPVRLHRGALAWLACAIAAFVALAVTAGVPKAPEGPPLSSDMQVTLQLAALGLIAVGGVVAARLPGLGGAVVVVASVALGVLAAVQYHPTAALLVCLAFLLPGVLLLLASPRARGPARIGGLALGLAVLLTAGGLAAAAVHDRVFGPAHPQSPLRPLPEEDVEWILSGGVTPTSAEITAKLRGDHDRVALVLGRRPDLSGPPVARVAATRRGEAVVGFSATGLRPQTVYHYAVEIDGALDRSRIGRFQTFPAGPASFTIAFAGCARTGSNGAVFDAIRARRPLLYINTGDLYYGNIGDDDPGAFRDALDTVFTRPAQSALYRSAPLAYVWDDHDYGGSGDVTSVTRPAALGVYREYVPSYPRPSADTVNQAFTVGRVRVIVTDLRSQRTPASAPDDAAKSMLGRSQRAWLERELLAARDRYPVVVWVSPVPWIDPARPGADDWAGYATERRRIADFVAAHRIRGLVMLSGDAHMLAIDDGSHSDYATAGGAGFPVMHAAALDRPGGVKGGPYSEGALPGAGQFGTLTVTDRGGAALGLTLTGWNWRGERLIQLRRAVRVDGAGR